MASVFCIINNSGIDSAIGKAKGLYNCYNHCPCARPARVSESWPHAIPQDLKPCQRDIATGEFWGKAICES